MTNDRTRANYDELNNAARRWAAEAERAQQMVATLKQNMDVLQGGGWVGQGARAFYAEMNGQVLPSLNRLVAALSKIKARNEAGDPGYRTIWKLLNDKGFNK